MTQENPHLAMSEDDYQALLESLPTEQFMQVVMDDVHAAIMKGHHDLEAIKQAIDTLQTNPEAVDSDEVVRLLDELETLIEKSYMYQDVALQVFDKRYKNGEPVIPVKTEISVTEMDEGQYTAYLRQISNDDFMKVVVHDVKKSVAIAHGYIALVKGDVVVLTDPDAEDDFITIEGVIDFVQEIDEKILESNMFQNVARVVFAEHFSDE